MRERAEAAEAALASQPMSREGMSEAVEIARRFQNRLGSCREKLGGDKGDEFLWDMCQRVIDGIGSGSGSGEGEA